MDIIVCKASYNAKMKKNKLSELSDLPENKVK